MFSLMCWYFFDLAAIDKLWVNMRVNAPKPKLTFIVVGKRWGSCPILVIYELLTGFYLGWFRHHAVFFPAAPPAGLVSPKPFCYFPFSESNRPFRNDPHKGNCAPGSVIDSDITHPSVRDFYLQSHGAIQGSKCLYLHVYYDIHAYCFIFSIAFESLYRP